MTRIAHISDNHSIFLPFPKKEDFDIIVHSGDFLPNVKRGRHQGAKAEAAFQRQWLIDNRFDLIEWIGDKQFLFCKGNHEFMSPVPLLKQFGIDAVDITEDIYWVDDLAFYGFPFIPVTGGDWSNELYPSQMSDKLDELAKLINSEAVNVLVAHCPISGILDEGLGNKFWGNGSMKTALEHKFTKLPKAYLCGHVHESSGLASYPPGAVAECPQMLVSNAATTVNLITL